MTTTASVTQDYDDGRTAGRRAFIIRAIGSSDSLSFATSELAIPTATLIDRGIFAAHVSHHRREIDFSAGYAAGYRDAARSV